MTLPEKILIGGLTYNIGELRDDTGRGDFGFHSGFDCKILVNPALADDAQRSTLLHECIEAINYVHQLGLDHRQIMTLEHAIDALFVTNPGLVAMYQGGAE